jgi:hypothetical protein
MGTTSLHIKSQRAVANATKEQVCEVLGWSEEQYAQLQYDTMIEYLDLRYGNTPAARMYEQGKAFRNWWNNGWCFRDVLILYANDFDPTDSADFEFRYRQVHEVHRLAVTIYPNEVVLKLCEQEMIKKLFNPKNEVL